MRLKPTAGLKRSRQRGVAAVEFALSMMLFIPLLFAILNYGYYFYVSITGVEAARVGARQLWNQKVTSCGNSALVTAASTVVTGNGAGSAKAYMAQIGMDGFTTVTVSCTTAPPSTPPAGLSNPVWQLQLVVDFPLPLATFGYGIPRSTVTPRHGIFRQTLILQGQ